MNYFQLQIEQYLEKNQNNGFGLNTPKEKEEYISRKAENALQEFESLRLSGLDVNTAHEITTQHLLENLNQLTN